MCGGEGDYKQSSGTGLCHFSLFPFPARGLGLRLREARIIKFDRPGP